MRHPHLDVLFEDQFSRFVADGLSPTIVVNASRNRINLGIRSSDESVDVFVGGLSASEARSIATTLNRAADAMDSGEDLPSTWTALEPTEAGEKTESDGASQK